MSRGTVLLRTRGFSGLFFRFYGIFFLVSTFCFLLDIICITDLMGITNEAARGLAANVVLVCLAVVVVGLRFTARTRAGSRLRLDDWTILASLVRVLCNCEILEETYKILNRYAQLGLGRARSGLMLPG